MKRIATYTLLLALCASCFKEVGTRSDLILRGWSQKASGADVKPDSTIVSWAFAADTAEWRPASYADAAAGVLTSRRDPSLTRSDGTPGGEYRADSIFQPLLSTPVDGNPVLLVAADTAARIYGWRAVDVPENLPRIHLSVCFRPWRGNYRDGEWTMTNEFHTPDLDDPTPEE